MQRLSRVEERALRHDGSRALIQSCLLDRRACRLYKLLLSLDTKLPTAEAAASDVAPALRCSRPTPACSCCRCYYSRSTSRPAPTADTSARSRSRECGPW